MSHKEIAAEIRKELKELNISACVFMGVLTGCKVVNVATRSYEQDFTDDEKYMINSVAIGRGLVHADCSEIMPTDVFGKQAVFFL